MSTNTAAPPPLPSTNPVTRETLLLQGMKQVGMLSNGYLQGQPGRDFSIWCSCQTSCFTVLLSLRKWGLIQAHRSQAGDPTEWTVANWKESPS